MVLFLSWSSLSLKSLSQISLSSSLRRGVVVVVVVAVDAIAHTSPKLFLLCHEKVGVSLPVFLLYQRYQLSPTEPNDLR